MHLVKLGRGLCEVSSRNDSREMQTVMETRGFVVNTEENTTALGYLCPALNQRRFAEEEAQRKRELNVIATAERRCASLLDRRPPTQPSLRARATVWVGAAGMLNVLEDGWDDVYPTALTRAFANKVVGATPGDLTILTADTDKHVCVAVEAYDKRPPVEVGGWEKVVEVGYQSTDGDMVFTDEETEEEALPDLAIHGAGRYRVRVHMRGAKAALADDGDARQAFLVIVYPGASTRTLVLR